MVKAIEKYYITANNIININKKGFIIRYTRTSKHIVTQQAYIQGQLISAQHNRNREWVTLLAAITALGRKLSPALIYKGDSYNL